jgi:hypothetical protein
VIRRLLFLPELPYRQDRQSYHLRNIIKLFSRRRDWIIDSLLREHALQLHCLLALA